MNSRRWLLTLASILAFSTWAHGQPSSPESNPIDAMVRKLGSPSFVEREKARRSLEEIGVPALDALRRASKTTDAETNRRINELIRRCEEQMLTDKLLTPKEVHLKLDDVPVPQAVAE